MAFSYAKTVLMKWRHVRSKNVITQIKPKNWLIIKNPKICNIQYFSHCATFLGIYKLYNQGAFTASANGYFTKIYAGES